MAVAMGVHADTGWPVWLAPCYEHKHGKEMAAPAHRLHMARHVSDMLGVHVFPTCTYETDRQFNGSTFELLGRLEKDQPKYRFHLLIGFDNLKSIMEGKWERGEELMARFPLIIVPRAGHERFWDDWIPPSGCEWKYVNVGFPSASRDVRQAIEEGRHADAQRRLHYRVWQYIERCRLYGYKRQR